MKNKKVVLFDLSTTGHHGYYAHFHIRHLYKKGYKVIFITWEESKDFLLLNKYINNLSLEYIKYWGITKYNPYYEKKFIKRNISLLKIFRECFTFINNTSSSLFHILFFDHNVLPLFVNLLFYRRRCDILATLFWPYFLNRKKNLLRKIYYSLTKFAIKYMIKKDILNVIFVHTYDIKKSLINALGLKEKIYREKIKVIPDPVFISSNFCSQEEAREKLNLPKDKTILLFFGVLSKEKGLDILLNAVRLIRNKEFILLIAGREVNITKSIIEKARKELENSIKIIPIIKHIPQKDVKYYFLSADAVVLPYRRTFLGTSGVLQQACGAGKPVIATDVGEVGKIVRKYNLGIIVEPESPEALKNGILDFLNNKEKIKKRVYFNVIQYAKENSWEKMVEIVENTYQELLKNKK